MSNGITIVSGIYPKYFDGGKVDYYTPTEGVLANVVKKSIEL